MYWRIGLAAILLFILGYRLNSSRGGGGGELTLPERSYAFGAIGDTIVVTHIFKVHNTGDEPLVVSDVHATCGCTATLLDKKTIAPGDSANLKVTLDPRGKGIGPIDKMIYITSNSSTGPTDSLTISAKIMAVHAGTMMTVKNIFTGDCRKCHEDKGEGKLGFDLFTADCYMCHSTSKKAHAPHLGKMLTMAHPDTTLFRLIAEGEPGTNMPAYAKAHGGPLSEEQIHSLVSLINQRSIR